MLNYAVIIQYLTQQLNIPNVRIAEWLNLDPSIISNIKNNKRKMQKDISYDVFYRDVFCQAEIGTDFVLNSILPEQCCSQCIEIRICRAIPEMNVRDVKNTGNGTYFFCMYRNIQNNGSII